MAELFDASKQNLSLHINNIFKENELVENSVVKFSLTTAKDGKNYKVKYYNLDVIISVGYRIKSNRGTQFRIWANQIIKDYLLRGYTINKRVDRLEEKLIDHDKKFDLLLKTELIPKEGIFYDGQIFDAYAFVIKLIKSSDKEIILIDNFIDESVLLMLSKRKSGVQATIYTSHISKQLMQDLEKYKAQYPEINMKIYKKSHDRFLIIDNKTIYHIGASLKDLGKKWFAFSKIDLNINDMLKKLD